MKRVLMILLIIAVLAGGGAAGYYYLSQVRPTQTPENMRVETVTIGRRTLTETVSASGSIEPEAEVEMKFETGGMVKEVLVKQGQTITAGTVLARLDPTDLELAVRSAEISLAQSKANLAQLLEPESEESIAAARAKVKSAQLTLADLEDGPDPDDVTKAEATLKQAEITLKEAQWNYDQVSYRGNIGAMSQANELQDATLAYESALADYNLAVKEATPAELAEAQASLASAQSSLAEVLDEPSEAEIAAQQADVDKAQLSLEEAQSDLDNVVLIAPTGGVVLEVNIEPGERVLDDADDAALTIADTAVYLLKMEVDELDIGQVKQGQLAIVTIDAFGKQSFQGRVTDVAPSPVSSDSDSIVTYEVTITLDTTGQGAGLLSGMTANANIVTNELVDVVVVPKQAVQSEESGGEAITYVEKMEQGQVKRVEIKTGLRVGLYTQVLAGLAAGDEVVIPQQVSTTAVGQ